MKNHEPTQPVARDRLLEDLWSFYAEHAAQARHHEEQRERATTLLFALAAALIGFAAADGLERTDLWPGALVVAIGLLGLIVSNKHYERNRLHTSIMGEIRKEIDAVRMSATHIPRSLDAVRAKGKNKHEQEWGSQRKSESQPPLLVALSLHRIWDAFNVLLALAGVLLVILALMRPH